MTARFYTHVSVYGRNILYRGYKKGHPVLSREPFGPTLFISQKDKKKSEWSSLYEEPLAPIKFADIREAKDFTKQYENVQGFKVHGMTDYQYQYINENFQGEVEYDINQMRIWYLDIEVISNGGFPNVETADAPVVLIAIRDKATSNSIVFGFKDYNKSPEDNFEYRQYKDEVSMLREFIFYWQTNCPDIVSGWNSDYFDFPYIINRINRLLGEDYAKRLSPFGLIRERKIEIRGKEIQTYEMVGVTQIDYLDAYRKFGSYSAKESYALGFIAQEELGETKLEIEGAKTFQDGYENFYDLFVQYNNKDAELIEKLDNKLKLFDLILSLSYLVKCNFKDVFGPVKMWDVFVFNHLHSKNIAVPPRTKKMAGEFEGAYVKDVKPGIYGWGISTDFASLYPTIIQQWNLSPETLVTEHHLSLTVDEVVKGKLTDYFSETAHLGNYTIAANGSMYRKDKKGIIPELMDFLSSARKIAKKEMLKLEKEYQETHNEALLPKIAALNSRQLALKVGGNSGYGALTNSGFRYFDLRIGEAITLTGQAADKFAEKKINEYLNKTLKTENFDYVIYCDTDSAYTNLQPLVDKICSNKSDEEKTKFLEKVGKAIQDGPIKESIDEMYELCNCYTKLMDMKLESVFSRAIWTAKKRYAMKVHSSEGVTYNPPKIKITGLDMIKSSTPKQIRSLLKDTLPIIFEGGEDALRQYVIETKSKFMIMNPEDIAFPRSASEIGKWTDGNTYRSGTPIHVRGCILYNQLIKGLIGFSTGISDKYDILMDGDKVKFIYLKLPNPIRENVISFPSTGKIPHELQFEQYVDYELQFEKTFIAPLKGITDAIGWSLEEKTSLEDFFG